MPEETQEARTVVRLTLEFPASMSRADQIHALQMALYQVPQVVNVDIASHKEEAEIYGNR